MNEKNPRSIALANTSPAVTVPLEMDFPDAVRKLLKGEKVSRGEWDDKDTYFVLANGYLSVHNSTKQEKPGTHRLQFLPEIDMRATDWVVVDKGIVQ